MLISEILTEANTVKLPSSVTDKFDELFDIIQLNVKSYYRTISNKKLKNDVKGFFRKILSQPEPKTEIDPKNIFNVFIPEELVNFFQFDDLLGTPTSVSVGFFIDRDGKYSDTAAWFSRDDDVLAFNLAHWRHNRREFFVTLRHELVHAMDPKVQDPQVSATVPYGETGSDRYYNSPHEFDAYTAPMMIGFENYLNKLKPEQHLSFKKTLLKAINDIKQNPIEKILNDQNFPINFFNRHWSDVEYIKTWSKNPVLFKKFLQRLYTEVLSKVSPSATNSVDIDKNSSKMYLIRNHWYSIDQMADLINTNRVFYDDMVKDNHSNKWVKVINHPDLKPIAGGIFPDVNYIARGVKQLFGKKTW